MRKVNLQLLKNEFLRIKSMGYIKTTKGGNTGIRKTFEDLLGKKEDNLNIPDFSGIEIMTKRGYTKSYTTLFNTWPSGEKETIRLKNKYGYYDYNYKKTKVLQVSTQANCSTSVTNRYLFKLNINKEERKIYLHIADKNFNLIEKKVFWDFDMLERKLKRKIEYLVLIKAWIKRIDGVEYYKYYDINFYKLKKFEEFINLVEDGTIRITFKVGVYKTGHKKGETHDRGTSFEIEEHNLSKLFDVIKV